MLRLLLIANTHYFSDVGLKLIRSLKPYRSVAYFHYFNEIITVFLNVRFSNARSSSTLFKDDSKILINLLTRCLLDGGFSSIVSIVSPILNPFFKLFYK
jgi:hypothetical protein